MPSTLNRIRADLGLLRNPEKANLLTCRKKLFDRNSPEGAGKDNILMLIGNKLFEIDKPRPFIPHLEKQREQLGAGPASGAETVINIGYHCMDLLLLKEKGAKAQELMRQRNGIVLIYRYSSPQGRVSR